MNDLPSELREPPARDYLFVCLGGLLVVLMLSLAGGVGGASGRGQGQKAGLILAPAVG